jgi:hypothetical protein
MNQDLGIRLQAYMDGELSSEERVSFEKLLNQDVELQSLRKEITLVTNLLRESDPVVAVPESQEFYFSQIRRRIEAAETAAPNVAPALSWGQWFSRALLPLGGVTVAGLMLMTTLRTGTPLIASSHEETEALLEETGAMTFRSDAQGVTVVWLYDKDMASATTLSDDE